MSKKSLQEVIERHRDRFMKIPDVIGVAGGLSPSRPDQKAILIYKTSPDRPPGLPTTLEGYPVEIVVRSRGFRAL